jgi:circadian clock protein KaiB
VDRARSRRKEKIHLSKYLLKLYITGTSPRADAAIRNLRRICEEELDGRYELEIIDVLDKPEAAETDRVLATPTLIKQLPPPLRRVIGDLSDRDKVLLGLEVRPRDNDNPSPSKSRP